jgi:hypothetical protein
MMRRGIGRGGPGLIGTMARTAVVAGTATAVSGNVARRQAAKAQAQGLGAPAPAPAPEAPAAAPPPPPAAQPAAAPAQADVVAQLRELAALRDDGILTDEEFAAQKARILGA